MSSVVPDVVEPPPSAPVAGNASAEVLAGHAGAVVVAAGRLLDEAIVGTVQEVHTAIAGRAFRSSPASTPVRLVHDTVSAVTYGAIRASIAGATLLGAGLLARRPTAAGWLDAAPGRATGWAIAHGVVGDRLAELDPDLDLPPTVRTADGPVSSDADGMATAFPDATGRVAVFLHGLTESDRSWDAPRRRRGPDAPVDPDAVVLPDVVAALGWTPVRVRYGTGHAIGRSGVGLAALLANLDARWPVPVEEIAFVGHSMGGLVARAALDVGAAEGHAWVDRVEHLVGLGTPHLGSWLERVAATGGWWLSQLPETRPFGAFLARRARGIKDLRHGALDDAGWGEGVFDADGIGDLDRPLPAPTGDLPLRDGIVHHLIAGRLTPDPRHPATRLFGDLLVHPASALGDDGRRRLVGAQVETLEVATGHFGLLRHPDVADHLRTWFA